MTATGTGRRSGEGQARGPCVYLYTNADTEVIAAESANMDERIPFRICCIHLEEAGDQPYLPDEALLVVFRRLKNLEGFEEGFKRVREHAIARQIPFVAISGERTRDRALEAMSTAEPAVVEQAWLRFRSGSAEEVAEFFRWFANHRLGASIPVRPVRAPRVFRSLPGPRNEGSPRVGVLFYQAHEASMAAAHVQALATELERLGAAVRLAVVYSLRDPAARRALKAWVKREALDVMVSLVWAGGSQGEEHWVSPHDFEGAPAVIQALCSSSSYEEWAASDSGLSPIDVATQVALPEFDGRICSIPFAFKEPLEVGATGAVLKGWRVESSRAADLARLVVAHGRLRTTPATRKRVAILLNAYPSRRGRLGNAVGLDSARSLVRLVDALKEAGYSVSGAPADPDEAMRALAEGFDYDTGRADDESVVAARLPSSAYLKWYSGLPALVRERIEKVWGPPPGPFYFRGDSFCFPGLDLGAVKVFVQPPRCPLAPDIFASYHSPHTPPAHLYLAFYLYLRDHGGFDAVVQLGKHGTLEWLPGKSVGLSAECFPDLALSHLPLVYPFVVNDPGEGVQAKRRAHAVIVDHLMPPVSIASSYGPYADLEGLLDEYAKTSNLDPSKVPSIRAAIAEKISELRLDEELAVDLEADPDEALQALDGYLCELKDAQVRAGLHVLGDPPSGEALIDMVCQILRASRPEFFEGCLDRAESRSLPGGARQPSESRATVLERAQELERRLVGGLLQGLRVRDPLVGPSLRQHVRELAGKILSCRGEVQAVLAALEGRFVRPGPAGAPTRGAVHALPTGRNFYGIDPRAVPTRFAWEVGRRLAEDFLERFRADHGRMPRSVALVVWGTACIRTGGDDIAEAVALVGGEPVFDDRTGRVKGFVPVPLEALGRPRVDVTLKVSGFFRDAFRTLIESFDALCKEVASLPEPPGMNPLKEMGHVPRVFGPPLGGYGVGLYQRIDAGMWEGRSDLAETFVSFSRYSYGESAWGKEDPEGLQHRLAAADAALKNQDNREHDIFDSDDYFQEHGGLVAAIAAASGKDPASYVADSSKPASPRTRALREEAARVLRTRVLNPKWVSAMRDHGYRGAAEIAATVDYVFSYDALTGVVPDWGYEGLASLLTDPKNVAFFKECNPWALRQAAERLLEAIERGLWSDPPPSVVSSLDGTLSDLEGFLE